MYESTLYPFVVSISGDEWDAIVENLNGTEEMPPEMVSRLVKKGVILVNEEADELRLCDSIAECVRFVSEPMCIATIECPAAINDEMDFTIFFSNDRHIIATRSLDPKKRIDFLISEYGVTPLDAVMKLAEDLQIEGDCTEQFFQSKSLPVEYFDDTVPYFRVILGTDGDKDNDKIYAYYPRKEGGGWIIHNTRLGGDNARDMNPGARQGGRNTLLNHLRSLLKVEFDKFTM